MEQFYPGLTSFQVPPSPGKIGNDQIKNWPDEISPLE
jgi:hypothetical protein